MIENVAAYPCRHTFLKSFKILLTNTHSHFPVIRDIIGKIRKGIKIWQEERKMEVV